MEIQANKRQKCLNLDYNNVEDKLIVKPTKILTEHEETFKGLLIISLSLIYNKYY